MNPFKSFVCDKCERRHRLFTFYRYNPNEYKYEYDKRCKCGNLILIG